MAVWKVLGTLAPERLPALRRIVTIESIGSSSRIEGRELAAEQGLLSVSQIVKLTGANQNTVKKHLQALVANQQLVQHGKGKGT